MPSNSSLQQRIPESVDARPVALALWRAPTIIPAMEWLTSPEVWISLFTLTVLEIVLGIDNIVFISILAG